MTGEQKYNKAKALVQSGKTVEEAIKSVKMTRSNYAYYRGKENKASPKVTVKTFQGGATKKKYAKRVPTSQVALIVGTPEAVAAMYRTLI